MTPVIPGFIPVIPVIPVIPAKAGIHTDPPPEPYCPEPPWPCHPREVRDPPLALDSRLRGNDDLRAWERVDVGVLRHPCWSFAMEFCDTHRVRERVDSRHSRLHSRHSRPHSRHSRPHSRHSREGGNPH